MAVTGSDAEEAFTAFARELEPRLRAALVARFGATRGREATVDTISWAWEHWDRVQSTENAGGFLYRVGCRKASRWRWSRPLLDDRGAVAEEPLVEPGLAAALASLTVAQRQSLLLVEGRGATYTEAAELLGISRSSVQTHVERALAKLRDELGVSADG